MEWLDLLPILNFEYPKHLLDIVRLVFELSEVSKDIANFSQFENELILKSLKSKLWNVDSISYKLIYIVKVVVGFPQISKRDKCC